MDLGLKDKLIVVTGGGAGIGAGISRACLAEGARVVVLGRRSENVQAFMDEMQTSDADCHLVEAHLEDIDRCKQAVIEIQDRFGDSTDWSTTPASTMARALKRGVSPASSRA